MSSYALRAEWFASVTAVARRRGISRASLAGVFAIALLAGCATSLRPPELLQAGRLIYPPVAKAQGIEGEVTLQYDVLLDGSVRGVTVVDAEPRGVFDEAALNLVRSFKFRPARRDGRVVASIAQTSTVRFKLDDRAYEGY